MIFFRKLGMFFYMALMIGAGGLLLLISLNVVSPEQSAEMLNIVNESASLQIAVAVVGGLFLIIGIVAPFRAAKKFQGARIIAFQNPDGEVTISLSAIEDYIRKVARNIVDIRDIRPKVNSGRKGINIICDVSMSAGANIPEATETLQKMVKDKLHGMLGVEGKVNMQMNVNRIAKGGEPESVREEAAPHVPYREIE